MKFAVEKLDFFLILCKIFKKALKMPQNYKYVILPITFYAFLGIFKAFLKILHKIWKCEMYKRGADAIEISKSIICWALTLKYMFKFYIIQWTWVDLNISEPPICTSLVDENWKTITHYLHSYLNVLSKGVKFEKSWFFWNDSLVLIEHDHDKVDKVLNSTLVLGIFIFFSMIVYRSKVVWT